MCRSRGNAMMKASVEQRLRKALQQRSKRRINAAGRIPSAVLLPLYRRQGEYHILFTRRTETVSNHKGQISFPGGAYQDEDGTLANTARRECTEEIGLPGDEIDILGELDDTFTVTSNYIVSPFVGVVPWPHTLKPDRREVEEIFGVPVPALLDEGCHREESRVIDGETITIYFYHHGGRVIWGATAQILKQFLDIFTRASGL